MKLKISAIRDIAVNAFGNPMALQTTGQALRAFSDEVNRQDKDNMMNRHPEDFELYELGEYDTDTGTFETHAPKQIATAKTVQIKT